MMGASHGDFIKYPRTPHLFGSKGTDDDKHRRHYETCGWKSGVTMDRLSDLRWREAVANRDDEFIDTFADRAELLSYWEAGWKCFATLQGLGPKDLSKSITIRGEPHSIPLAIHRSLAHCGYHVGQIVMIARILAGDAWNTITIPRDESETYNQAVWGKAHYRT